MGEWDRLEGGIEKRTGTGSAIAKTMVLIGNQAEDKIVYKKIFELFLQEHFLTKLSVLAKIVWQA